MNPNTRRPTTPAASGNWLHQAACTGTDPELFFPLPSALPGASAQIAEAKRVCAGCPVRVKCLDEALEVGDRDSIRGGFTPEERYKRIGGPRPASARQRSSREDGRTAHELAAKRGAQLVTLLVKDGLSVPDVAERMRVSERAVYRAFTLMVPASARSRRTYQQSAVERVLAESEETLRQLHRLGRSPNQIANQVGSTGLAVECCLAVLAQRERVWMRLTRRGVEVAVARAQGEERRVRLEAREGLTPEDVLLLVGPQMRDLRAQGVSMREVAARVGFGRDTVRLALEMLEQGSVVQGEMGVAA
ncbi:WhiB family transcriptional regulator [Streptomyces sp. NPDC060243]|uniref:WhiB family transcriptional regulator n=1 Tax=Streptomyces sp. NPDC060243 TaxID=3347081 RepID=UPI0036672CF9